KLNSSGFRLPRRPGSKVANRLSVGAGDQAGQRKLGNALVDEPHGPVTQHDMRAPRVKRIQAGAVLVRAVDRAGTALRRLCSIVESAANPVFAASNVSPAASVGLTEKVVWKRRDGHPLLIDDSATRPLEAEDRIRGAVPDVGHANPTFEEHRSLLVAV